MATDYKELKAENIRLYGEDIGRIGPMLLADRYDDRTHFIFELLQNAEDALRRRTDGCKPKSVQFRLAPSELLFSHFGLPFTEKDVRGICGIAESTKVQASDEIGRFGIGFKAVYAFTDAPEIHSGAEHFAIDSFVWPRGIAPTQVKDGETVFVFPFRSEDYTAHTEIASSLSQLSLRTLLFLQEIDEINWGIHGGDSGTYVREAKFVNPDVREITLLGQLSGGKEVHEECWIVFRREVFSPKNESAGAVEAAFRIKHIPSRRIEAVENATLSVFFPTIVPVHFGVILQGPYRTTPSRDNIQRHDEWNRHLVSETGKLLHSALHDLKSMGLLDASALQALPIHRERFSEKEFMRPLFEANIHALNHEELLPRLDGRHTLGSRVKLGRTREIRELLSPEQLGALFGEALPLWWVTDEVTENKTPQLRQFLITDLGIGEVGPESVASKITDAFLAAQDDPWTAKFYSFLRDKESLWRYGALRDKAIVRLESGKHVPPFLGTQPQAFLPGSYLTNFPTVKAAVCGEPAALEFLRKLGLGEPDPVDDVIINLLPKYRRPGRESSELEYSADLQRILNASKTNLKTQRDRLIGALRDTPFVAATDSGSKRRTFEKPGSVYQSTERLKTLFEGVEGVFLVENTFGGLRGEAVRDLLEVCGCAEYLVATPVETKFSWTELSKMRRDAGCENNTGGDNIIDQSLRGLDEFLKHISSLPHDQACARSGILWEALCDAEDRGRKGIFSGTYRWFYFQNRSCEFDAAFLKKLTNASWVPNRKGSLDQPRFVVFEDLQPPWKDNAFLRSKIAFKPRLDVEMAAHIGIESGALDLLKRLGLTSEAELRRRLGISETSVGDEMTLKMAPEDVIEGLSSGESALSFGKTRTAITPGLRIDRGGDEAGGDAGAGGIPLEPANRAQNPSRGSPDAKGQGERFAKPKFYTYVTTSIEDSSDDDENMSDIERLQIEEKAIAFIRHQEPDLKLTPKNNPGFDLFEGPSLDLPSKFVEVKSRRGPWVSPVALSSPQFLKAQKEGDRFWLYVVENVGSPSRIRLHRIQDPVGKARFFTFDSGWALLSNSPLVQPVAEVLRVQSATENLQDE
jgi:Domain of unknown function (DUF3883)